VRLVCGPSAVRMDWMHCSSVRKRTCGVDEDADVEEEDADEEDVDC